MARRRKEERRAGSASLGMVRRWRRCSSRVRHRAVPDRERVPERCHSSGAAVDICSDALTWAPRAARTADGGVVDIARTLSGAQCVARCDPLECLQLLATKKVTSRDTVGLVAGAKLSISKWVPVP
jgi:hypothetical protein